MNRKAVIKKLICLMLAVMLLAAAAGSAFAADTAGSGNRTVRVGFFAYPGYHQLSDGVRSGYGYDFLMLLQRYTNLNYEFVGYENSWEQMQQMLLSGEIDMVTSARKTPEREEIFDFSQPIGTNSAQINVRSGDDRFVYGDFRALDGKEIGLIEGNSRNSDLERLAEEKGFTYTARLYDSADELERALSKGQVDAVCTSSLRKPVKEKTIAEFAPEDFYVIVRKGDTELLDEINYGIGQMDTNENNWRDNLYYANYHAASDFELILTTRERDFIISVQRGQRRITVTANPDSAPYSFAENGRLKGIIPDYFDHLMGMVSIPYHIEIPADGDEYLEWTRTNRTDVVIDFNSGSSQPDGGNPGLLSDSYMQLTTSRVTEKGFSGKIRTVAVTAAHEIPIEDENIAPDAVYTIADTEEEALQAVKDGKADACYVYTYTAERFINRNPGSSLQSSVMKNSALSEYFCISPDAPHELCSILNKCIKADAAGTLDSCVRRYTTATAEDMSFVQYLKLHPELIMFGSAALLVLVILLSVIIAGTRRSRLRNEQLEREMERLGQVKGLASQFSVLYFVNLDTLETDSNYLGEETPEDARDIDRKSENFFEAFRSSMVAYAHPDHREELLKYADPAYMKELLRDKFRHEHQFLCMNAEGDYSWTNMVLMKFSENEDDEPVNIAVGYMNTDREMRERLDAYDRQKRDLEAIRGLAGEYDVLQFTDIGSDTFSLYYMTDVSPEKAKEMTEEGGSFSEYFRQSMQAFCHPDFLEQMLALGQPDTIRRLLSERKKYSCRFLCNSDSGYQWCEFALIRLDNADVPKRVAVAYTNINESVEKEMAQQKALTEALEAAEAASRAKSEFLFNMSHDIRTPMNAITGFTDQAIRHRDDPALLDEALGKVKDSSAYLLRIINDILDMAKIESGKLELDEKLHIGEKGKNTLLEVFGAEAARKGIDFTSEYDVRDRFIWIDENRTNQIVANLISNAIKYTDRGGSIKYSVKQIPCDRPGYGRFAITVSDNGCGMSQEFLTKIFDAFEREGSAKRSGAQGTGLGMAIVKKLSDVMGGTVDIQSEPGMGTAVTFTSDHRIATDAEIAQFMRENGSGGETVSENLSGRRVLLVEDNELNREIAVDILEDEGLEVEEAEDGTVAVDILREKGPDYYDFVLMDIQMPQMNGYEATRAIREMYPEANLPIIALSANAFAEDRAASLEAGMNDHVAKPINVKELFSVMSRYI